MAEPTYITVENNREAKLQDQKLQNANKEDFRKNEEENVVPGKDSAAANAIPAPPAPDESPRP